MTSLLACSLFCLVGTINSWAVLGDEKSPVATLNPSASSPSVPAPAPQIDFQRLLVSARKVALGARLGTAETTGPMWVNPNASDAKAEMEKAVHSWGRFTIVRQPQQADLVLVIVEETKRSGFWRKNKMFEQLLVYAGGSPPRHAAVPLWQRQAEVKTPNRAIGMLIDLLRGEIETSEKRALAIADSEVRGTDLRTAPADSQGPAPSEVLTENQTAAMPPLVGPETGESFAAVGEAELLLSSRTVAVVIVGPAAVNCNVSPWRRPDQCWDAERPGGGESQSDSSSSWGHKPHRSVGSALLEGFISGLVKGVVNTMTYQGPPPEPPRRANAKFAQKQAERAIGQWNRYELVKNPADADLVFAIREWNHYENGFPWEHLAGSLEVLPGGTEWMGWDETTRPLLWSARGEQNQYFPNSITEKLLEELRAHLEHLETPPDPD